LIDRFVRLRTANEMDIPSSKKFTSEVTAGDTNHCGYRHLRVDDTIRDVLSHPAFDGFPSLILPWDDRPYEKTMELGDIGSLLPYHSHVNPAVVVSSLNRMIDTVNSGQPVFYDFYTDVQKRAEPTLKNAGLFFFRGRPGAPFAVIAPGGGFSYVGSVHEGFPYAVEISSKGYNAFVLKYRVGHGGAFATRDLAAAISYIFGNADTLGIGTSSYSLWGSSAGARMVAAIGSYGPAAFGGAELPKPSLVVTAYTGHSDYAACEPTTFIVVGEHDAIAPPSVMRKRAENLRKVGAQVEFHRYPGVGHGFGLGTGTSANGWVGEAVDYWGKEIG
jgi:acetyl esterase/lipase